jgi:hypothetical protein
VATLHGNKAKVIAISGQDSIENRSNIVQALNRLATRVVRSGEPLWYDGSTEDLPPQLEEAIEEYVDLSHGRTVTILPIHRPERTIEGDVLAKQSVPVESRSKKEVIGALIVEQIETQLSRQTLEGRVDLVYEHSCRALSNTLAHEQLFLMPLWRFLGRLTWLFRGSALPKTLAVLGLLALATLAMFLVQIDFDLEGNGSLQPLNQRQVFAHIDGEVDEVLVEHGSTVKLGDTVVKLRNRDLEVQITNLQGQMTVARSEWQSATYQLRLGTAGKDAERFQLESKIRQLDEQLKGQAAELEILLEKQAKLARTAPISGEVTTWEVEKNLRTRPVQAGQVLLNIADPTGAWEVEVLMPEKRMKYLDDAFGRLNTDELKVEFILMTDPSKTHTGLLSKQQVHQRAEVEGDEGPVVKLRVIPDSMEGISRRPGTRVIADVKCGKRSAAFTWFYEVIEWVRAHVIF